MVCTKVMIITLTVLIAVKGDDVSKFCDIIFTRFEDVYFQTDDITKIGKKSLKLLADKYSKIKSDVKGSFKVAMGKIYWQIDDMVDGSDAPIFSESLFETAESYINMIQNIDNILHNFDKQLYQLKMHVYKDNNEARAEMDATVSLQPRGFFSQNLYSKQIKG